MPFQLSTKSTFRERVIQAIDWAAKFCDEAPPGSQFVVLDNFQDYNKAKLEDLKGSIPDYSLPHFDTISDPNWDLKERFAAMGKLQNVEALVARWEREKEREEIGLGPSVPRRAWKKISLYDDPPSYLAPKSRDATAAPQFEAVVADDGDVVMTEAGRGEEDGEEAAEPPRKKVRRG